MWMPVNEMIGAWLGAELHLTFTTFTAATLCMHLYVFSLVCQLNAVSTQLAIYTCHMNTHVTYA